MARFTGLSKGSVVWIRVAIRTLAEGHPGESRRSAGLRRGVAFLAGHLSV